MRALAVTFRPTGDAAKEPCGPTLEWRADQGAWSRSPVGLGDWQRVEVRGVAACDPVSLGSASRQLPEHLGAHG
jgi:hypothetical protein